MTETLMAPIVNYAVALGIGAILLALAWAVLMLSRKISAWLTAKHQEALASLVTSAGIVLNSALNTGASVIAGKIQRGELDYTKRADWEKEAVSEVAMAKARVPDAVQTIESIGSGVQPGALVANLMAKVDAAVVASPTIMVPIATPPPLG